MAPQGIRLPRQLQEQLDEAVGVLYPEFESSTVADIGVEEGSHRKRHAQPQISRKETRKQERQQRKQNKAHFFSFSSSSTHSGKRQADDREHIEAPSPKKVRLLPFIAAENVQDGQSSRTSQKMKTKEKSSKTKNGRASKPTALERLAGQKKRASTQMLPRSRQEEEEEVYIAYLEQKLGWGKGGGKDGRYGPGFEDDGLDDLLNELDGLDGFSSGTSNNRNALQASDPEESSPADDASEDSVSESENSFAADSWHGLESSDEEDAELEDRSAPADVASPAQIDHQPGSIRYVPPHLRQVAQTNQDESEEIIKLTRQLKGQLNRLSEQNIASIVDGIEEMYIKHRRHDVTATLTKLIIDGIASHSVLLDSYVVLHAAFVSAMHKIIGNEFAAYFTQTVVSSYERYYHEMLDQAQENNTQTNGKECSNLIVLLSELYNFQVISYILIYDVIRDLLSKELTEWNVELLLKTTRNSGLQLRQDDPSALKDIIQIVQSKISGQTDGLSSRMRFMLETLINLKNNKLKNNATPGGAETIERLKKYLSGLSKKRHVLGHEHLRVSLEDLHTAESKGKWWLVGAAWSGNPLVDRLDNGVQEPKAYNSESALVKLARKQGMNTDIRRSIFVVLMSSEDYLDACERLAQLNLSEVQQREIVRVVIHCCGKEKVYNPFYTLVCQQLCRTSHSYKITLQFCLWDFLRSLGESDVGGTEIIKGMQDSDSAFATDKAVSNSTMHNIAKAYAWWIAKDCCTIAVLKPVDFTILKPKTRLFFREFFTQLFISSQASSPTEQVIPKDTPLARNRSAVEQIFIKATRIETLALGLLYFLSEEFRDGYEEDINAERFKWALNVANDTLRT